MKLFLTTFLFAWTTVVVPAGWAAEPAAGMNLDILTALLHERARQPWDETAHRVPAFLDAIGYDQYRDYQYKDERMLWREQELPFELSFFHPGYIYRKMVTMVEIRPDGQLVPIPFSTDLFDYGPQQDLIRRLPRTLDFSGFHLWQRNAEDEEPVGVGLFQGASYFRMVSSFGEYGLSARTLAVDTTTPEPEEFPEFTTFWFVQPEPAATDVTFYGFAESRSLVAGYRFVLTPGTPIRMRVEGRVVLREEVAELGLTPFSTMFWYAENSAHRPADFRPEVHDSDGLFIETGSERIWRPLSNPARTRTDILPGNDLVRFGLQQRDRDYEHYQDIEADYHLRPDAWIVPGAAMREGTLRLLEIETPHEYADNVALVWVPDELPAPGELFAYDYEVYFGERPAVPVATVVATRYGESLRGDGSIEFVIDFAGGKLDSLDEEASILIDSEIAGGEFIYRNVRKNPYNDTWRLSLRVLPDAAGEDIRLGATLRLDGEALSETWLYWWYPAR